MKEMGASGRERRGGRHRLRRFLAASAAVLAGATGIVVATPGIANAAVNIIWGEANNTHYVVGDSTTIDGICHQSGQNNWVASCRVEIYASGGGLLASHDIPVPFHFNNVNFGVPAITSSPGAYIARAYVTGTGGASNSGAITYWIDPPAPPPVTPPSATITSPGAGTHVNPNAFLQLQGFCSQGTNPLANCYAQVWGPTGYHDLHAGDALPTWASGDYYVRLTASDGTYETPTDTSYHVNYPPGVWIEQPSFNLVVNEGSAVPHAAGCYPNDGAIVSCTETVQFPNLSTANWGFGALPSSDYGYHRVIVNATDTNGLASETATQYRVNALPKVFIDAPVAGDRYYTGDPHPSSYHCTDFEGISSCIGNVGNGANVDTSTPGAKTFTVTAIDSDGAVVQGSRPYNVYDRPVAHLDGPAVGTVINPGDAAPVFGGYCTGGMPPQTCTMTVQRPGGPLVTLNTGDLLPIDVYATYTMRVHIVDDIGTESEVIRTYKVNEPPHIDVDEPDGDEHIFVGQDKDTIFDCYDNDGTVVVCDGEPSPIGTSLDVPGHYFYDVLAIDNDGAPTRAAVPYHVHPVAGPCRARGLVLLNGNYGDANPAADPCASAYKQVTSLSAVVGNPTTNPLGKLLAPLLNTMNAGVVEGRTTRTAPATFAATADVANAVINIVSGVNLQVTGVHSEVESRLLTCETAAVSGRSRVGTIRINGVPLAVGEAPLTVPLVVGTLYLNQQVRTGFAGITQRALFLDLPGTTLDVIIGESTVSPFCGPIP